MTDIPRFDDGLPRLLGVLVDRLGRDLTEAGIVLRDATGRLSFFSNVEVEPSTVQQITDIARSRLGHYARPDRVFVCPGDPGAERVLQDPGVLTVRTTAEGGEKLAIRYVDRRIVGADWLRRPAPTVEPADQDSPVGGARPLRVAFSSLKGGVGRSTALTVVAVEQARRGRNVLVIDLDLEAPGIGSLLLPEDRMPSFGVVDYLVERNFDRVDREFINDMVGTSALTQGQGLVNVAPAVGQRTLQVPENYLAKLSRAMVEAIGAERGPVSLAEKLREMLADLEAMRRYDLVLIDVRAGLAELTAGPLLALDAEVLIFGTDQRQTIQDLRFLLSHLAALDARVPPARWDRLKMVHAKATQAARASAFRDELWDLFSSYLYVESLELEEFNFDADDPEAPHYPIVIPLDTAFADWDPVTMPDKLIESYYARTFGALFTYLDDLLTVDQGDDR